MPQLHFFRQGSSGSAGSASGGSTLLGSSPTPAHGFSQSSASGADIARSSPSHVARPDISLPLPIPGTGPCESESRNGRTVTPPPPPPLLPDSATSLGRSASVGHRGVQGSSPPHGSPGRYHPTRLLRRKNSTKSTREPRERERNTERERFDTGDSHGLLSALGGMHGGLGAGLSQSRPKDPSPHRGLDRDGEREYPEPGTDAQRMRDERRDRSPVRGTRTGRSHSGTGVPPAPVTTSSNNNTGSLRSLRSDNGGSGMHVANVFSNPTPDMPGGSLNHIPPGHHPFLLRPATPPPPEFDVSSPLSPPRRPTRSPKPPPPPRIAPAPASNSGQGALATASPASTTAPLTPLLRSRPNSPTSSGSSDSAQPLAAAGLGVVNVGSVSRETAAWLARKPSGRHRAPINGSWTAASWKASSTPATPDLHNQPFTSSVQVPVPEPSSASVSGDSERSHPVTVSPRFSTAAVLPPPLVPQVIPGTPTQTDGSPPPQHQRQRSLVESPHLRPRTPDVSGTRRGGGGYEVSVQCLPHAEDDEVRWEVVVRRTSGNHPPQPAGPLDLGVASTSLAHAPPLASSVNLSLALDTEHPTGKLVFIALPDQHSTPTRTRSRSSVSSPRGSIFAAPPRPTAATSVPPSSLSLASAALQNSAPSTTTPPNASSASTSPATTDAGSPTPMSPRSAWKRHGAVWSGSNVDVFSPHNTGAAGLDSAVHTRSETPTNSHGSFMPFRSSDARDPYTAYPGATYSQSIDRSSLASSGDVKGSSLEQLSVTSPSPASVNGSLERLDIPSEPDHQ
ncbi:uncharacterized protein EHS24_001338 [Apiotrichum porosum]|uniref:Uncharacterized protein n=1 Tax=Apiotrichum porosum TaxID=105984 RepID=A0A427XKD7_9TREE|nr:uncharacterized protein EHS24_001338 [Apiotrichum porosum]RSH79298.1 hypothetical protein EHS24_001338 [Apiotrichum porosum]